MLRRRRVAITGIVLGWGLVLLAVTVLLTQLTGGPGTPDPIGERLTDPGDPAEMEASAFLETHDLSDTVVHFTLAEEEAAPAIAEIAGGFDSFADLWVEVDDEAIPLRMVVRIFDADGEMQRAMHSDGAEQLVALLDGTRTGAVESCIQRNPPAPELVMELLPFMMSGAALEAAGYTDTTTAIEGAGPPTEVDDRVGEPIRTLTLPALDEADQYERPRTEQAGRAIVAVDPDTGVIIGQALLGGDLNGEEVLYRQAMGDIHVHERGAADDVFDIQDAIDLCAELES